MFNQGPMRRECSTCDDSTANAEGAKVNQRPFRFKRTSLGGMRVECSDLGAQSSYGRKHLSGSQHGAGWSLSPTSTWTGADDSHSLKCEYDTQEMTFLYDFPREWAVDRSALRGDCTARHYPIIAHACPCRLTVIDPNGSRMFIPHRRDVRGFRHPDSDGRAGVSGLKEPLGTLILAGHRVGKGGVSLGQRRVRFLQAGRGKPGREMEPMRGAPEIPLSPETRVGR
jgi:hypothetical protein